MTPRQLSSFPWPTPPGSSSPPQWNGREFVVADGGRRDVLCYDSADSNWSPELTALHEAEAGANHPIDQASRARAVQSIQRFARPEPIVLDVGSSSGFVLDALQRSGSDAALIGSDFLKQPLLALAKRLPGVPLLQFDLSRCPLPTACVDAVIALNVMEHIADHEAALREIFRILKPGGVAHIEVPAGPQLFDIYDEHLMHHRRYTMPQLRALATQAGFELLNATHLGMWIYPAFAWVKRRNRRLLGLSAEEKSRIVAGQIRSTSHSVLLRTLLRCETAIGRAVSYPFGIRCVLVARKPSTSSAQISAAADDTRSLRGWPGIVVVALSSLSMLVYFIASGNMRDHWQLLASTIRALLGSK
jgi:SAM-dependent methyltransferase